MIHSGYFLGFIGGGGVSKYIKAVVPIYRQVPLVGMFPPIPTTFSVSNDATRLTVAPADWSLTIPLDINGQRAVKLNVFIYNDGDTTVSTIFNNPQPPVQDDELFHPTEHLYNGRRLTLPTTQGIIERAFETRMPAGHGTVEASFAAGADGDFIWAALPTSRTVLRIYNRDFPLDDILANTSRVVIGDYNLYSIGNVRDTGTIIWEIVI